MPTYQQKPKNLTHDRKLKLLAPTLEGGNWEPSFSVIVTGNNVKLEVWSNRDGDRDKGQVVAKPTLVELLAVLQAVETSTDNADGEINFSYEFKEQQFEGGRPGPYYTVAQLYVGKDKEGYCFISLIRKNHQPIPFRFMSPKSGSLAGPGGNAIDPLTENKLFAKAWAKTMEKIVIGTITKTYVAPPPKEPRGNGYSQQQAPQQQASAPKTFDETLPF